MNIAVVGAGIAGPSVAHWLVRAGHSVTLYEIAPAFRTNGYMIDFWGVGFDVAERMGLMPAIRSAGYDLQEVRYVNRDGRTEGRVGADLLTRELGDRYISIARGDLAEIVFRSISDRVETVFGAHLMRLVQGHKRVELTFADGTEREHDLVIGADGLHSAVRDLAFGLGEGVERDLDYGVAAFRARGYRPRDDLAYVSYGLPGRQIARFAQRDDWTMFLFVFASERLDGREPRTLEERKQAIAEVFADSGWEWPAISDCLDAVDELYFDRVVQIEMPSWSLGRVALVGDAAACVSLLAGEGAGLAMTEAYVLAGELERAGGDHGPAFGRYEDRLRRFVAGKQKAARGFASSFAPRTAFGVWLRNKATLAMSIPGVPQLLIGAQLRDSLRLPDYEPPAAAERA